MGHCIDGKLLYLTDKKLSFFLSKAIAKHTLGVFLCHKIIATINNLKLNLIVGRQILLESSLIILNKAKSKRLWD